MRYPSFAVKCFVAAAFLAGATAFAAAGRTEGFFRPWLRELPQKEELAPQLDPKVLDAALACFTGYCLEKMEHMNTLSEAGLVATFFGRNLLRSHLQAQKPDDPELRADMAEFLQLTDRAQTLLAKMSARAKERVAKPK